MLLISHQLHHTTRRSSGKPAYQSSRRRRPLGESRAPEKRRAANPARKQKTSLERLPNWAVRSGPRARNEREAAARSRRPCEASGQRDAYR